MDTSLLKITYDKVSDSAYLYFSLEKAEQLSTDSFSIKNLIDFGSINIDFDKEKRVYGLEILSASKYLPVSLLEQFN